jgi:protein-L-isoaspartate(D-aspartate) O-methyltransferase
MDDARRRALMVRTQIEARGVRDLRVLAAMREVPRERFVPDLRRGAAFEDAALPIECGQTISQPYVVAAMVEALLVEPTDRVLEVGCGSGYAAAVLAELASEVWAVERHPALAEAAGRRLVALGYANVHVRSGDGTLGLPEAAPFDGILVSAGAPSAPPALLDQLAPGGRLVLPEGTLRTSQTLVRYVRQTDGSFATRAFGAVCFVPLVGAQGWPDE